MFSITRCFFILVCVVSFQKVNSQQRKSKVGGKEKWKKEVMTNMQGEAKLAQEMVDMVFSFAEHIPSLPGHNWSNAIAMATPIAHKGVVAGAKVVSATVMDMLRDPKIIADAWDYHKEVQLKNSKYIPFIDADTKPAIHLYKDIMEKYRPEMKKYYYDPAKHHTYLEQLGIQYPELRETGL